MDYLYTADSKSLPKDFDIDLDLQEDLPHFCAPLDEGREGEMKLILHGKSNAHEAVGKWGESRFAMKFRAPQARGEVR